MGQSRANATGDGGERGRGDPRASRSEKRGICGQRWGHEEDATAKRGRGEEEKRGDGKEKKQGLEEDYFFS